MPRKPKSPVAEIDSSLRSLRKMIKDAEKKGDSKNVVALHGLVQRLIGDKNKALIQCNEVVSKHCLRDLYNKMGCILFEALSPHFPSEADLINNFHNPAERELNLPVDRRPFIEDVIQNVVTAWNTAIDEYENSPNETRRLLHLNDVRKSPDDTGHQMFAQKPE